MVPRDCTISRNEPATCEVVLDAVTDQQLGHTDTDAWLIEHPCASYEMSSTVRRHR